MSFSAHTPPLLVTVVTCEEAKISNKHGFFSGFYEESTPFNKLILPSHLPVARSVLALSFKGTNVDVSVFSLDEPPSAEGMYGEGARKI